MLFCVFGVVCLVCCFFFLMTNFCAYLYFRGVCFFFCWVVFFFGLWDIRSNFLCLFGFGGGVFFLFFFCWGLVFCFFGGGFGGVFFVGCLLGESIFSAD